MPKLLSGHSPHMAEAIVGEYAAGRHTFDRSPIGDGNQIKLILDKGMDAVEIIANQSRLSDAKTAALYQYLEGLEPFAEQALTDSQSALILGAKAAAVEVYSRKYRDAVHTRLAKYHTRSGQFSNVYQFELDGTVYMARNTHGGYAALSSNISEIDKHMEAAIRLREEPLITDFEQVEAISYGDQITIAPHIPGQRFRTAVAEGSLGTITDDSIAAMYDTMKRAEVRGVTFDGLGPNLLVKPDGSLAWVDMGVYRRNGPAGNTPERAIADEWYRAHQAYIDTATVATMARLVGVCLAMAPDYNTSHADQDELYRVHDRLKSRG